MDRANAWPRKGRFLAPFVALALLVAACGGGGGGTAPTVTTTNPADAATNVPVNADVAVTFSQTMNQAATEAAFSSVPAITCAFSWNPAGTVMNCNPTSDLNESTSYTVTISTGATNSTGAPLAAAKTFSFTTADAGAPGAPTVVATTPAGGTTGVSLGTPITVSFSAAMNTATAQAAFSSVPAIACGFTWNAASTAMTCTPASELATNTAYAVTIAATAENASGAPLGSPFTFGFTTGGPVEATCVFGTALFGSCRFGP